MLWIIEQSLENLQHDSAVIKNFFKFWATEDDLPKFKTLPYY